MIPKLGRLRIALGRERSEPFPAGEDASPEPPLPPQIEFVAYAADCLLSGWVRMAEDRLTDLLNAHEEYELLDVYVEDLENGTGIQVANVLVQRDELLMVHAVGPRGNRGRRRRMLPHPVAIQIGQFHVRGYVHALPGSDPIAGFRRHDPMVPITDAWIECAVGTDRQRRRVDTVIVNRELVDWIVEAIDEEVKMPDLPLSTSPRGQLVKDFTGQFHTDAT